MPLSRPIIIGVGSCHRDRNSAGLANDEKEVTPFHPFTPQRERGREREEGGGGSIRSSPCTRTEILRLMSIVMTVRVCLRGSK